LSAVCFYRNSVDEDWKSTSVDGNWKSYGTFSLCIEWLNSVLYYNIIIFSEALSIPLLYMFLKIEDTFDILTCYCFLRGTRYEPEGREFDSPMVSLEFYIDIILLAALWP